MDRQTEKQRQGRAETRRVPGQGRQSGGGNRYLAGRTSFGRLPMDGARHARRPFSPFRPVFRQPEHGAFKSTRCQVATRRDVIELRTSVQDQGRNTLPTDPTRLGKGVRHRDDLLSQVHADMNAAK